MSDSGTGTWALATCKRDNKIILGGLGAMGCGVMAFSITPRQEKRTKGVPDFPTVDEAYDHAWDVTLGVKK